MDKTMELYILVYLSGLTFAIVYILAMLDLIKKTLAGLHGEK